jgi:hypothetical protein
MEDTAITTYVSDEELNMIFNADIRLNEFNTITTN